MSSTIRVSIERVNHVSARRDEHFVKISSFITLNLCSTSPRNSSIASESRVAALLLPLVEGRGVVTVDPGPEDGTVWETVSIGISMELMIGKEVIYDIRLTSREDGATHICICTRHDASVFFSPRLGCVCVTTNGGKLCKASSGEHPHTLRQRFVSVLGACPHRRGCGCDELRTMQDLPMQVSAGQVLGGLHT